jgi:hypothetical protein
MTHPRLQQFTATDAPERQGMIGEFGNVKAITGAIAAGGFHLQNPSYGADVPCRGGHDIADRLQPTEQVPP